MKHNSIRNVCCEEAAIGGLRPEREKAGLLPPRPAADGLPAVQSARRPADIWVPRGTRGGGEAFDFAISSGLQSGPLNRVVESPEVIFADYETVKRQHLETEVKCRAAGFSFTPVVLESHGGGMSKLTRNLVSWLGKAIAAAQGSNPDQESLRIAQRMSSTLHRESARAILRRLPLPEEERPTSVWASAVTIV